MEQEEKLKFYSLAKYPNLEILMDSQLQSAGANQAKLLEKYKRNKNAIKRQLIALKVVYGFIFIFIPFFSVWGYLEIVESYLETAYLETILLTNSFVFGMFFLMSILYVILMGLFSTSSFMSGNAFKWLQTLPLSKGKLQKLGYVTLFRNLDIALIALIFGFPTILLIMTQDFWLFLMCIASSSLNAIFAFSLLVILSEKMAKIFSESSGSSKKASILRIVTMGGFFLIAFSSSFLITFVLNFIEELFVLFPTSQSAVLLNRILSFIPFPFGITYLIAIVAIPGTVPIDLIITSLVGFVLFIGLTYLLYRSAIDHVKSVLVSEVEVKEKKKRKVSIKKELKIEIIKSSKIKAFIHKDLISTTRDYQSFIFLIMPIVYPVILILGFIPAISGEILPLIVLLIIWSVILLINQFIPFMLVAGFLNMEESGTSILASLPLLARTQAKAKLILMLTIQAIGLALTGFLLMIITQSLLLLLMFFLSIPIGWIFLLFTFILKIRFFGKMKYKYVIEEVNKERKVLKWVALILSEIGIFSATIIIEFNLFAFYGIIGFIIGLIVISIVGLTSLIYIFTRMFPKEKEMATYYTGGLLRRNVIAGSIVIMGLFFIFMFLVNPIELILSPLLIKLEYYQILIVNIIILFGLEILLFIVLIPRYIGLPNGKSTINEYSYSIGLTKIKPITRNIVVGILSFVLYSLITYLFAILLGTYSFDPDFIFGDPLIYGFGWAIFYVMLQPGIWEEIAFRGVILNLQLKRYSKFSSIIVNGIFFGLFHFVNLIYGQDIFTTLFQVFFATCLGIALAYTYVKTKSLLPCILLHYLINTVGILFRIVVFTNLASEILYLIFGISLVPMLLILGLVKLIVFNRKE